MIEERRTSDGGIIGLRVDITEMKRREASFRLLFDGNPVPMFVYALDDHRILAVNDAALEHYGFARDEFLAMSWTTSRTAANEPVPRSGSDAADERGRPDLEASQGRRHADRCRDLLAPSHL